MDSQKHPRLLNEIVLSSECPEMSREERERGNSYMYLKLNCDCNGTQFRRVSNKGTIIFCGTGKAGW